MNLCTFLHLKQIHHVPIRTTIILPRKLDHELNWYLDRLSGIY